MSEGDDELKRGIQAGFVAYVLWGLLTVYWKALHHLEPIELIAWRIVFSFAVLVPFVVARRRTPAIVGAFRAPDTRWRLFVAAVLIAANWICYVWAIAADRVLETALGYFIAPIATMALGTRVLGERLTPLGRLAQLLGLAAVVVIAWSYGEVPWAALVIAGSWSFYGLIKRQVVMPAIESLTAEVTILLAPALATIAWYWNRPEGIPTSADGADWILLAFSGLATAVPLVLFAVAARRVPFTILGPINYLVPLINFVLGWLAYGEDLPASRIIGFGLVWIALGAVTVDRFRQASRGPRRAGDRSPADRPGAAVDAG